MNIDLSLLDLSHIQVALEAYIDDAIDARHHSEEPDSTPETSTEEYRAEYAEFGVIIEEASDLLARINAAMLG